MSLTTLPKEVLQEIALCYALSWVSAEDKKKKEILLPASLQAPLPAGRGNRGPHYDPMLKWQTRWRDGARVASCTPQASCHSPLGMLSDQSQFCYELSPNPHDSPVFALLSICRTVRNQLLGTHAFWSQVSLMLPYFLPWSLEWIPVNPGIPVRLECLPGLSQCDHIFSRIQDVEGLLQQTGNLRLTLPCCHRSGQPMPDLIKNGLLHSAVLQTLELRFDAATRFHGRRPYPVAEFPNLRRSRTLNSTFFAWGPALTELNVGCETPDVAIPVDVMAEVLSECRGLQELTLQFALRRPQSPEIQDDVPLLKTIVLTELEFLLIADSPDNYFYLWVRMDIPGTASVHPDIVIYREHQTAEFLRQAVTDAAWKCLDCDSHAIFPSLRTAILDYHAMEPNVDAAWPEYIRLTFAKTEAEASAETDPRQTTAWAETDRCSFTVRFHTAALMRRYPPVVGSGFSYNARIASTTVFRGFLKGLARVVDLSLVKRFVEKAGGRAQALSTHEVLMGTLPNLRDLVLYGVTDPLSVTVVNLVEELARGETGDVALERVQLPDWDHATDVWDRWNEGIRASNAKMRHRPDILWSK